MFLMAFSGSGGQNFSFRALILNFIRLMLVLAVIIAIFQERDLVLLIALLGILVTFIPWCCRTFLNFNFSSDVEVISLLFVYGFLIFGGVRFGEGIWWWYTLMSFGSAVILGFVGLNILYFMNKEGIIEASYFTMSIFTFFFAFSLGGLWKIFEFLVDLIFGFDLSGGEFLGIIFSLIANAVGAIFVSFFGYFYLKSGKQSFVSFFIEGTLKKNFRYFRSKRYFEHSSEKISQLVELGENERLEFKSTLRKNLHTGQMDKNMSHAVLKTIVAYLNSNGGTLLVGVNDSGEIIGLEKDGFPSQDQLKVYFTGLLRNHLGNQFLPFIQYELYPIKDKHVLKIDCSPSIKRVFLKWEGNEEFYVRHGSTTLKLSGNDLLDYVAHRFK